MGRDTVERVTALGHDVSYPEDFEEGLVQNIKANGAIWMP